MPPAERTRYYQVRPRRIPPEFCSDELLEDCSVLAALLLTRVISLADDQGRLPGHPKYIRATAFGMRPTISVAKVASAIGELGGAGFLIRYDVAGREFLQVARWFDLQGKWAQRRTYPSRYPAPPGWTSDWVTADSDEDDVRALGAQSEGNVPAPSPVTFPPLPRSPSRVYLTTRMGAASRDASNGSSSTRATAFCRMPRQWNWAPRSRPTN